MNTRSLETEEFHNRHLCIQNLKLLKTKILKDHQEIERCLIFILFLCTFLKVNNSS